MLTILFYIVKYPQHISMRTYILYKRLVKFERLTQLRNPLTSDKAKELFNHIFALLFSADLVWFDTKSQMNTPLLLMHLPSQIQFSSAWVITNFDDSQGPLLLIWFNFLLSIEKNHMRSKVWDEITYPFSNFNGCTVEVLEWKSNLIPHIILSVITYPHWD